MEKIILEKLIKENKSTYEIATTLKCSQTNVRYWLKKHGLKTQQKVFLCKFCGESRKNFFHNKGKNRLSYSKCKSCHNRQSIERFRQYKLQAIEYKGGKCVKCGYSKCPGSLHFHHLDSSKKDPKWKQLRTSKFETIKKELDKCELVCGNCHGEIHWLKNE